MTRSRTIQLKAIFLLVVFALNTLVGFACAIDLNMGFNTKHHHDHPDNTAITAHHHAGSQHIHHHPARIVNEIRAAEDGNCCNNNVVQLSQLDKLLAQTVKIGAEVPATLVQLHFLYQSYLPAFAHNNTHLLQFVRPYVLSSRGIRVSIQSFQI